MAEIEISTMSFAASLHFCLSLRTLKFVSSYKVESNLNHLENIFICFWLWAEECDRGQRKFYINRSDTFGADNKKEIKIFTTQLSIDDVCLCWMLVQKKAGKYLEINVHPTFHLSLDKIVSTKCLQIEVFLAADEDTLSQLEAVYTVCIPVF